MMVNANNSNLETVPNLPSLSSLLHPDTVLKLLSNFEKSVIINIYEKLQMIRTNCIKLHLLSGATPKPVILFRPLHPDGEYPVGNFFMPVDCV